MIIKLITFGLLLKGLLSASAQTDFLKILEENQLTFEKPADFEEVPVKENPDLYYNYAMKHITANLEVRYSIFSLKQMLLDYEESKKDTSRTMLNPNNLYKSLMVVNILNISQLNLSKEGIPKAAAFNSESVMQEFGCEYGATAFFEVNSTFSEGYKYCSMVYLHKENVADVCICYLMKKPKDFEKYFGLAFHALRFI
ncbi:MAG: hypothetical protein HYZ14_03970 [Bacteroidetes bacterium]|nr:hypothetical protein [Bacteroidota bacterium]